MPLDILRRPRRNRRSENLRRLVRETALRPHDLIWPLFVHTHAEDFPIASMPGVSRLAPDSLLRACERAMALGLPAVAVFPCIEPALKDDLGSHAFEAANLLLRSVSTVKTHFPELVVITDVALDPYTSHGHDGLLNLDRTSVENDRTVEALCRLAVLEAEAGADIVAPSDMMDGRIGAIRRALDAAGFSGTGIMSYAAKYCSAYYGPFRDAVGSKLGKDAISKATYQMDPANAREALREVQLDLEEGADILMVKPAGPYLDIIRSVRDTVNAPLAAYQVSGEFAQIHAAAQLGWLDYERTRDESLLAIKRAGADIILTY
ncbi:MAG: porphobilinogen synthase, partial [Deltaproteobacteria bacterium]